MQGTDRQLLLVSCRCEANFHGGGLTVRSVIVDEVQVVCSEVYASKGSTSRHGEPSSATSGQKGVEIRRYGQRAGVSIISCSCYRGPNDVDRIVRLIFRTGSLAQEVRWSSPRDIDLLSVIARSDEDNISIWPSIGTNYSSSPNSECFLTRIVR